MERWMQPLYLSHVAACVLKMNFGISFITSWRATAAGEFHIITRRTGAISLSYQGMFCAYYGHLIPSAGEAKAASLEGSNHEALVRHQATSPGGLTILLRMMIKYDP
ncbi:hypothetical protein Vretimale_2229 [Volvox reticuliferus]|uniref:Uncharacterized protein n=1 Tax=Volvox reticuliferus TaxID=1737510 RepID=A0A8J4G2N0_9CHLO|nr:hypothetical protein Vretifemale_4526 [Volvox reticuliferus]GIL96368.1 hypothetical protein Vretimale_2229 [Volvox reticuliferus]